MEKNNRIQTLHQLIEAITQREGRESTRMLRVLQGHISMAANRDANQIRLTELADLRDVLRLYLAQRREEGHFHGHTPRSYMNFFRVLAIKAEEYAGVGCSLKIQESWKPIWEAVRTAWGCRHIIQAAIRNGIRPQEYSDAHLNRYCEERRRLGRHPESVRLAAKNFRDGVKKARLTEMLPKLTLPPRRENYGVRLEDFPDLLRTQRNAVVDWKLATFVKGRPTRYRCREVTVRALKFLFSESLGYARQYLNKDPQSITELFSEDVVRPFADWLLKTRRVSSQTVADRLRLILPLARHHPFLKGSDFAWLTELISELPPPDREKIKRRKEQKFVHFSVMATVPGQLLKKAEKTEHLKKKAILVRDALLIEVLLVLAWRQRNIRECVLAPSWEGGNIFKEQVPPLSAMALPLSLEMALKVDRSATFWQFSFDCDGTKSKRPIRAFFPRQVTPLLERYIELRPVLLKSGAPDSRRLFLNGHGDPLTPSTLAYIVAGITSRNVAKTVNPHLFRDIHSVGWLSQGRKIDDLSNNLWHTDPGFTRKVYAGLYDESFGTQGVEEWLSEMHFDHADGLGRG
jgi:hypothetical protein